MTRLIIRRAYLRIYALAATKTTGHADGHGLATPSHRAQLRPPRRADDARAGPRMAGALAALRHRAARSTARPGRALRTRRAPHGRDRFRQRRGAGRARRGSAGGGFSRARGAQAGRRTSHAALRGTRRRQPADHLPATRSRSSRRSSGSNASTKCCCISRIRGPRSAITSDASCRMHSSIWWRAGSVQTACSVSRPTGSPTRSTCSKSSAAARASGTNRPTDHGFRGPRAVRSHASNCGASVSDTVCGTSRSAGYEGEREEIKDEAATKTHETKNEFLLMPPARRVRRRG